MEPKHEGPDWGSIIPEKVKIQLTARSYDEGTTKLLLKRIEELAKEISKISGAPNEPQLEKTDTVDAVFNDVELSQRLFFVFKKKFGKIANASTL